MMSHLIILLCLTFVDPVMTSIVGTGHQGYSGDGGPASMAELNQPFDVAYDRNGHLYLSDTFNQRIRKVDARSGIITTIVGSGKKGFGGDGGPATQAKLDEPYGLAFDAANNLYIVDRLNRRIRKVDANTGVITTIAGDGSKTSTGDGGLATKAGLVEPNGIAIARDTLYIADVAGHRVRAVALDSGIISTFAGDGQAKDLGDQGPASRASVNGPRAVDVAPDGAVYILERNGHTLRVVDGATGVVRTIAGTGKKGYSGDGGPALLATFDGPKELCLDREGNILIVETENQVIRKLDRKSEAITTLAGSGQRGGLGDGGSILKAQLDRPHGVAVSPGGVVVISDTNNHRIRAFKP